MGLNHSPQIVTNNLLLNLDFKNPKRVSGSVGAGNLVQAPTYDASTWINYFPTNNTITTGIQAPDGSNTAVRFSCVTTGSSLLRVLFNGFTPNGLDTYVISFWVKKVSGSISTSNQLWCDLHDSTPSINYAPSLVTGEWVRVSVTGIPAATYRGFLDLLSDNTNDYVLDFWGVKIENASVSNTDYPIKDTVGGYVFNVYHPQFSTLNYDNIQFTRNATAPKWGGAASTVGTGALTSTNFLYNDHTWEVWFRIDDVTPTNIPTYETMSCLAMYSGWHSGLYYSASSMQYVLWNSSSAINVASWTVGTSGAQINQGLWYQLAIVRSGNVFTPYINGAQVGTGSTTATTPYSNVTNNIWIGGTANVGSGVGEFLNYSKNTVTNMKMYNRALTAAEVAQNFNALRGRVGI